MKKLTVGIDLEYDNSTLSTLEVVYAVKKAIDLYFNGDGDYEEDVLRIIDIHEDATVLSPWDKGKP